VGSGSGAACVARQARRSSASPRPPAAPDRPETDRHLWITGPDRASCAEAIAAHAPDAAADCDRRLRGPYTGAGSLMRALVPRMHERQPALVARHAIEILAVAPELEALAGPAPQTFTSLATGLERARWRSRHRTRQIAHGLVDFLRECAAEGPLTIAFSSVEQADPADLEFLTIALRRLSPQRVRLIVCSAREVPALGDMVLASYCRHQIAPGSSPRPAPRGRTCTAVRDCDVAAFVASDGISDVAAEVQAYLGADPRLRERLHDERAAALQAQDEWSLRLGAIPYHLEHGSSPRSAWTAYEAAIDYCIGMACYETGLELARRLAALIDPDSAADAAACDRACQRVCQCLALLDRPAETEAAYYDLLSRSPEPAQHMRVSYALAMLYTRLPGPASQQHRRALAHMNTAIVIADRLDDPRERVLHSVFMDNGKAVVELHLGHLDEALRLVNGAIAQLGTLLPDQAWLYRSTLHHNRGQILAALGRTDEALADFDRVIEADPNYPEYRFGRGNLLAGQDRYDEALADYEATMRLSPPFAKLYFNRGRLRALSGDTDAAVSDFSYVLDLEPAHLEARISLVGLLLDAGDPQAAVQQARAGLAVSPGEARLYCTLGLALLDLADHTAACQAFSQALDLDPGMPDALVNRAAASCELGRYDAADADLSAVLDIDAGHPGLLYSRGFARAAAGRTAEAIADYTLALEDPRADRTALLYQRSRCHASLAHLAEARRDLEALSALDSSPREPGLLGRLELWGERART
jgi:tetratricopeptide (TPR) repeat protein